MPFHASMLSDARYDRYAESRHQSPFIYLQTSKVSISHQGIIPCSPSIHFLSSISHFPPQNALGITQTFRNSFASHLASYHLALTSIGHHATIKFQAQFNRMLQVFVFCEWKTENFVQLGLLFQVSDILTFSQQ
jgi:hypothetical protein